MAKPWTTSCCRYRYQTGAKQLSRTRGNRNGVIPLVLPGTGDPASRLELITRIIRAAKLPPRAASNALIGPVFRTLGRTGVYRRFIDHQRLVNTFVTNVRGPVATMSLAGNPVTEILPLGVAAGNVTVSFAALSYAGNLVLTIASDPDTCPDLDRLTEAITSEVLALSESARGIPGGRTGLEPAGYRTSAHQGLTRNGQPLPSGRRLAVAVVSASCSRRW
ncbi:WS/DGAT domain-containing protein [Salinibacterium sp. ZJ450]|uniref:WS/DGAT domain-containing protein n=1 Tax=Salinibacterium sp. ZJ450 TaxID=2708338 RepID=UPI002104B124|nr:WS/DGAT domain-containing protein [Salinibacterium sp. ZJ450]